MRISESSVTQKRPFLVALFKMVNFGAVSVGVLEIDKMQGIKGKGFRK